MGKTRATLFVSITITPEEFLVLSQHTNISRPLLQLISRSLDTVKQKRKLVKRVKVNLELKQLDRLIHAIASKANQRDATEEIQERLDSMFGRFAEKYNQSILY